jgi:hypothetical protein
MQPLDLGPRLVDFTVAPGNGNGNHNGNGNGNGHTASAEPMTVAWGPLNGKDRHGLEVVEFAIALEQTVR